MDSNLLSASFLALAYAVLFGSAEWLYRFRKVPAELTRKYVHVITGLLTLLFPVLLDSHWWVFGLCGGFAVILVLTQWKGWLPSIHAIDRLSRGSILYPAIVYSCFLVYERTGALEQFYLPILVMAICDPVAALAGKKWPYGRFQLLQTPKTLIGSSAFLVSAFLLSLFLLSILTEKDSLAIVAAAFMVALSTAIAEALSGRGYDNFTIPLTAVVVLWLNGYW